MTNQTFINRAVFGALDFAFTDSVKGHVSARHTRATDNFSGCSADVGDGLLATALNTAFGSAIPNGGCVTGVFVDGAVVPAPPPLNEHLDEKSNSWRVGLDWKADANNLLYANVSRGYKGGSFPDLSAFSPLQYQPVVQESLTATEAGVKSTLLEQKLQLNAALFYYNYENKQVRGSINTMFPFGILPGLVNVPKSEEYGLDAQALWKFAPGWTASLNATVTKSRILDNFTSYDDFSLVKANFGGEPLPNTPEVLANADLQYAWDLPGGYAAFVDADANYASATNSGFGEYELEKINPYAVGDVRGGVDSPERRWRATVYVNNVADKYYWVNQLRIGDTVTKLTGMPRVVGVTFTYRFR